ncbi:MAG: helix-turn-helix domain-containing protein [Pseudomonadota bacterium]|jgi:excisionase family DNA binding protein
MINKSFFSKAELSEQLGVSIRTIDNWIASGLISFSKIGRRIIFSKKDLDEFIERNRRDAINCEDEKITQSLI